MQNWARANTRISSIILLCFIVLMIGACQNLEVSPTPNQETIIAQLVVTQRSIPTITNTPLSDEDIVTRVAETLTAAATPIPSLTSTSIYGPTETALAQTLTALAKTPSPTPTFELFQTQTEIARALTLAAQPSATATSIPIPTIQPSAISTALPSIGKCENLPSSDNWLLQCSYIPKSGNQITWQLDAGQILYVSGETFRYENKKCGPGNTNVCVFIYKASSPTTITLDGVYYPNWLGITTTQNFNSLDDVLADREAYFWKKDNCSIGCRTATVLLYEDSNLIRPEFTVNNPDGSKSANPTSVEQGQIIPTRDNMNALFGTGNWFCVPDRQDNVRVRRIPQNFQVTSPFFRIETPAGVYENGQIVRGNIGTFWLIQDIPKTECPDGEQSALKTWADNDASQTYPQIDNDFLNNHFGNGKWNCFAPSAPAKTTGVLVFNVTTASKIEYPYTTADSNDQLFSVGETLPAGRDATIWFVEGKVVACR